MNTVLIIFASIIGLIASVGAFMYIIIMGPSRYHRDGLVGKMHRIITSAPLYCGGFLVSVFFGCDQRRSRACCGRCATHSFKERNWFMVMFYIALVWTVEVLYLFFSLPKLQTSIASKATSWILVLVSEVLYGYAVFSDPGTITTVHDMPQQAAQHTGKAANAAAENQKKGKGGGKNKKQSPPPPARSADSAEKADNSDKKKKNKDKKSNSSPFSPLQEYILNHRSPVDGIMYALASEEDEANRPANERDYRSPTNGALIGMGQTCTTCGVPRPARSRHCRLCHRCVRRYDHHCPWINNDVAEGTYRYFLGFLFFHAVSCTWACYDLYRTIKQFLVARRAWGWVLHHPSGRTFTLKFIDYVLIIVNYSMLEACLLFFAFAISLVLYGFWIYQMTFAVSNLTVNDMNKIDDVVDFVAKLPTLDLVYREAKKVRDQLDTVAERKPTALKILKEPPLPKTVPGYEEGGKKNSAYRKRVRKMLVSDLKGMYDRGMWNNLMEALFPYSLLENKEVQMKAAQCVK